MPYLSPRPDPGPTPYVPTRPDVDLDAGGGAGTGRRPDGRVRPAVGPRVLGTAPGQLRLLDRPVTPDGATRLEREHHALPELAGEVAPRPLWRRPAFVVSCGLALVAIVVCSALLLAGLLG